MRRLTHSLKLALSMMPPPHGKTLFGQPRGLATLFFTEMWERFSYYGMRAILTLFMVTTVADGGLGIADATASSIFGLYVAGSYLTSLLGGWIADRLLGAQRVVIAGAVFIMVGNALLASGSTRVFFVGLVVAAFGVGFLKPNVSALIAPLYPEGGSRRDAGFSLFYMGINVGALFGAMLVPICAAKFGWHWGFALPAAGMLLGLVQFLFTRRYLAGPAAGAPITLSLRAWLPVMVIAAAVVLMVTLAAAGRVTIEARTVAKLASWAIGLVAVGYFTYLIFFAGLSRVERQRVYVMLALFVAATVYYAGQEQAGTSLTLFADRYTDRHIFGWNMPAGMLQGISSLYILIFAPLFSALWIALGRRGKDPSMPVKFAIGLALMGAGFLVMFVACRYVLAGEKVAPTWLMVCYLIQMWGDLCLAPVGLSSMTKLAAPRFVGQVMGVFFLSVALGNNLAGQLASEYDAGDLASLPALFLKIFGWGAMAAAIMLISTPWLKRQMAGVK
jgi:POT family proton-dependent oligopeptide transporter